MISGSVICSKCSKCYPGVERHHANNKNWCQTFLYNLSVFLPICLRASQGLIGEAELGI